MQSLRRSFPESNKSRLIQFIKSFFTGNFLIIVTTLCFFCLSRLIPGSVTVYFLYIPVIAVMVLVESIIIIALFIKKYKSKSVIYLKPLVALTGLVLSFLLIFTYLYTSLLYYNNITNTTNLNSLDSQYSTYPIENIKPGIFQLSKVSDANDNMGNIIGEKNVILNLVYPYEFSDSEASKKTYVKRVSLDIDERTKIQIIGQGDPMKDEYFEIISGQYYDLINTKSRFAQNNLIRQMSIKKTNTKIINDNINNHYKDEAIKSAVVVPINPKYLYNTLTAYQNGRLVGETTDLDIVYGFHLESEEGSKLDIFIPFWADTNFDRKNIDKDKKYKIKEANIYYNGKEGRRFATKLYLEDL